MMKKNKLLKTLLLLTVMLVGSATNLWAVQSGLITGYTLPDIPAGTLNLSSQNDFTADTEGWIVFYTKNTVNSKTWWKAGSTDGSSGKSWTAPTGTTAPFKGGSDAAFFTLQAGGTDAKKTHAIRFTGAEKAAFLVDYNSEDRKAVISLFSYDGTNQVLVDTKSLSSSGTNEVLFDGLSVSTEYVAYIYGTSSSNNSSLYEVALKAPAGAVDPEFSLIQSTITIDETSQIQVGSKGNLDGITLTDLAYDATVISIDGTTGLITPVAQGTSTITFKSEAVTDKYNAGEASLSITVTAPQVETPTITASTYFVESQTVEISCETEGASIKYSTDDGATWLDYTSALTFTETTTVKAKAIKNGYLDSEEFSATYTKTTLVELVNVTGAATWDWSKFGIKEIKLTDDTKPSKSEEFVLANVVNYGFCESINEGFGNAQQLKVTCEYPVRESKYLQGGYIKFYTEVPGTVEVVFSNTGNRTSEDDARFLNINGTNTDASSLKSSETTTGSAKVKAGEVTIKGTLKKDDSDQYLRIYKIVFTPTTADETAPVFTTAPTDEATDVAIDAAVTLTADEDITAVGQTITGTIKAGDAEAAEIQFTLEGKVLTYAHDPFENNTTYTVTLNANQVQDAFENKNAETSFSFTTEAAAVEPETPTSGVATFDFANVGTNNYADWTISPVNLKIDGGKGIDESNNFVKIKNDNLTVTLSATNAFITKIVFTYQANNRVGTAIIDGEDIAAVENIRTWTNTPGKVEVVSTLADCRLTKIDVTYVSVIKTTIGSTGWSTFCSDKALDFTGLDVKAYMVTGVNGTKVEKLAVNETVPANTPLLLNGVAAAIYSIPVVESSETSTADNKLVAGTGEDVFAEPGFAKYVMVASEGKAVFKKIVNVSATVPVGKAYLKISEEEGTAPMFSIDGDDDTTGINSVERGALSVEGCYTLDGRRVENPTKGLYIVNGKKVIIK